MGMDSRTNAYRRKLTCPFALMKIKYGLESNPLAHARFLAKDHDREEWPVRNTSL
jgi:hypothetical protein